MTIAVKDNICTSNMPTTCSSLMLKGSLTIPSFFLTGPDLHTDFSSQERKLSETQTAAKTQYVHPIIIHRTSLCTILTTGSTVELLPIAQDIHRQPRPSRLRSRRVPFFVDSDGLAIIRDVENPEPTIETDVSVVGTRPNKTNLSGLQRFKTVRHDTYSAPPKHTDGLYSSAVLSRYNTDVV